MNDDMASLIAELSLQHNRARLLARYVQVHLTQPRSHDDGEILLAVQGVMQSEAPSTTPWLQEAMTRLGECLWTENKDGQFETDCKHMHEFFDGGPQDNHLQFCGYCGKRVVERRWGEAGDGVE
jgi:hypothetical protein